MVSIVRLHGEACWHCGAVNATLRAAGEVSTPTEGGMRIWPVVACTDHRDRPVVSPAGSRPRWMPADALGLELAAAGEVWDAVRMSSTQGDRVLEELGDASGGVIEDTFGHIVYWLIPAGSASTWQLPAGHEVQVLGTACHVMVPGPARTRSPFWRTRPGALTDPGALYAAVLAAHGETLPPQAGSPT